MLNFTLQIRVLEELRSALGMYSYGDRQDSALNLRAQIKLRLLDSKHGEREVITAMFKGNGTSV